MSVTPDSIGKTPLPVNPVLAKIIAMTRPQVDTFEIAFGDSVMTFKTVGDYATLEAISAKCQVFEKVVSSGLFPEDFKPYIVKDPSVAKACAALAATIVEPPTGEMEFMVMASVAPLLFRFVNDEWAKWNNGLNDMRELEELDEAKKDSPAITTDGA